MDIHAIDPADEAEVAEAHAAYVAAESYGRPRSDAMDHGSFASSLRTTTAGSPWRGWVVRGDGAVVGVGLLRWPTLDNLQVCWGWVSVLPEHRRRGYGGALLATLCDAARDLGRTRLELDAIEPVGAENPPSHAFLAANGLRAVMHEERSELRLPVPGPLLADLSARVPAGHPYLLETWTNATPEHRSAAFRGVLGRVEIESPHGDRDVEPEQWTEGRLRTEESRRRESGWTTWTTAAFTSTGECAGFTELCARTEDDPTARQSGTLVTAGHRGHRLGLAVKLANLRALQADRPDLTAVTTYTSPENAPMRSVNDALGFSPIETLDLWSLDLGS
ncbi:MAG: GNAT family N-acetyltransferase [Nocardioidaceae bacterium]